MITRDDCLCIGVSMRLYIKRLKLTNKFEVETSISVVHKKSEREKSSDRDKRMSVIVTNNVSHSYCSFFFFLFSFFDFLRFQIG